MAARIIPDWLMSMINAEFNTTQKQHESEKGYFCVNCGGESITRKEKEEKHAKHKVLKAYNTSRKYAYNDQDIYRLGSDVLDVSGIRPFSINNGYVFFPKSRSCEGKNLKNRGRPGNCFTCGYRIDNPYLFCSIHCKVSCDDGDEELRTMQLIMKQEDLGEALKKQTKPEKNRYGDGKRAKGYNKKGSSPDLKKNVVEKGFPGSSPDLKENVVEKGFPGSSPDMETNVEMGFSGLSGLSPDLVKSVLLEAVDMSIKDNKLGIRRRRRKGIPHRAPFF